MESEGRNWTFSPESESPPGITLSHHSLVPFSAPISLKAPPLAVVCSAVGDIQERFPILTIVNFYSNPRSLSPPSFPEPSGEHGHPFAPAERAHLFGSFHVLEQQPGHSILYLPEETSPVLSHQIPFGQLVLPRPNLEPPLRFGFPFPHFFSCVFNSF